MVARNVQAREIPALSALYSAKGKQPMAGGGFEELLLNAKTATAGSPADAENAKEAPASDAKTEAKGAAEDVAECGGKEAGSTKTPKPAEKLQKKGETQEAAAETDAAELTKRVAALILQVTETVKDMLGLTKEQLQSALEELGMAEAELLSPEMLTSFYLNVKQETDALALVTDASLLEGFTQLSAAVEALTEQSGIPEELLLEQLGPEELGNALGKFLKAPEEAADGSGEELPLAEEGIAPAAPEAKTSAKEKEVTLEFKAGDSKETASETAKKTNPKTPETAFGEQFLQNLEEAVTQKAETLIGAEGIASAVREIANQLLERVRVVVAPNTTSLEIQLTPEHLGKVGLTISEQDGVLKAKFFTENELARKAIESNLLQFKETLNEQGLKVESIEVMVSEFSFGKNAEAGQSGAGQEQKGRRHFAAEEAEDGSAQTDRLAEHFLAEGESTVNYMA